MPALTPHLVECRISKACAQCDGQPISICSVDRVRDYSDLFSHGMCKRQPSCGATRIVLGNQSDTEVPHCFGDAATVADLFVYPHRFSRNLSRALQVTLSKGYQSLCFQASCHSRHGTEFSVDCRAL